jgi:parallel beta-helix repeat protein
MTCGQVCRQWKAAATDFKFVLHVLPVELGATHSSRKLPNHFGTIADAMKLAHPGDTIELGDGHYWVNAPGLEINFPVRLIGDENDSAHVVVELTGSINWKAKGGFIEGVTFRRPKIATVSEEEIITVVGGKVDIVHCVLDNECSNGNVASVESGTCNWYDVVLKGSRKGSGMYADKKASVHLDSCQIRGNDNSGVVSAGASTVRLTNCQVENNRGNGLLLREGSKGELLKNRFAHNDNGVLEREPGSTCVPCSGNIALIGSKTQRAVAGFRLIRESESK